MRSQKKLLVDQLDRKMKPFKTLLGTPVPDQGWIRAIRKTLNMTLVQLGARLGVDYQSVQGYEEREVDGRITLQRMKEVGEALEMHFVYGFVPRHGSIKKLVEARAQELARSIVMKTHTNMLLENQGTDKRQLKKAIDELADEFSDEVSRALWN